MTLPHPPIGSPYQAPRDCILYGFTHEEKEDIARRAHDGRRCWHCGRWFLLKHVAGLIVSDFCTSECLDLNTICYRIEREDLLHDHQH